VSYDIELGQNDIDTRDVVLQENGTPYDLSEFDEITLKMKSESGTEFTITCNEDPDVPADEGGVRIPFTNTHTSAPILYYGKIITNKTSDPKVHLTFPSGNDYISIKVWGVI
jgi:hypothetical protein